MDGSNNVGSIVALEHVNVQIPDQQVATLFYVTGLGLTRDPYLMTGLGNMWINVGRNQFHLPTGKPQVLRGHVGLVMPDLEALLQRLSAVQDRLAGTQFAFREEADHVAVVSPWGNRLRCFAPAPRFGPVRLGIPYVELEVAPGTAVGIARFYREILDAPAEPIADPSGPAARVSVGPDQSLIFRETDSPLPAYDGHHVQVYVAGFAAARERLERLGLVTQVEGQHQYRFTDIVDLDTRRMLFVIEHEVRSLRHPLYARKLVNRNPAQTNMAYVPGADGLAWELADTR
jgi:hypothetical protein